MDLIDRQAAIDAHCELCGDKFKAGNCDICPDVEVFRLLPSAQTKRKKKKKKGWWIREKTETSRGTKTQWKCSNCGAFMFEFGQRFCSGCGLEMER